MFIVHLLYCTAPSAFAADNVGLRTRVSVKRACLGGAQRDAVPEWASTLPAPRKSPLLLETLATAVPALKLGGPLSQPRNTASFRGRAQSSTGGAVASSGKGKSRFLYELNERLQKESRTMCIPITFNGQQNLDLDIEAVESLTAQPRQKALMHLVLRLLHATFEIDDLQVFAGSFCDSLKADDVPLNVSLLREVVAECAKTRDSVENVTILVDESGRLPKLLKMDIYGDEFSALRSLCAPASVKNLGFSVMLMQAGLGDFAEQTVSSRDVKVIALLEQDIEEVLENWVLYEQDSKASVQGWVQSIAERCSDSLKMKANDFKRYKDRVLRPLVVEYAPLPRALEYLTEAVKQFEINISATKSITTEPELGSAIRRAGLELRDSVDVKLNSRCGIVAERLSPAVLAPAILPSHRLRVRLKDEIGGHRVAKLLSEAAYSNTLQTLRADAKFLPQIVPAFLRQAAAQQQPDLQNLQAWWVELEKVLVAQASGNTTGAGNLLDVGVRLWTHTILLALRRCELKPEDLTLADIFPSSVTHRGLQAANYKMQIPAAVTLQELQEPLNSAASTSILKFAIKKARNGRAAVLGLADGQAGADSVAVLPLDDSEVLLLGLEPHGGASNRRRPDKRHAGHPQDKRSVFWQGFPPDIQEEQDVQFALLYITHDNLTNKTSVLEKKWDSTVERDCNSSSDRMNLLLMDMSGLRSFFGPLWPLYAQARYMAR